jgi:O-antigen/teichoic acid export membrane protein
MVGDVTLYEGPCPAPAPTRGILSLQALTRQSAVNMAGGLISQALKFFVVIYVARQFSVAEFGLFSFAVAVNAYMFIVSNFGLPVYGSRAVAQSGSVSRELAMEICWSRACLALLATVLTVGILALVPGVSRIELQLVGIFGLSNLAQAGLFDWAFQGLHRQEISAILNVIWQGSWLVLAVLSVRLGLGIRGVAMALLASALIASSVGYLWLRDAGPFQPAENGTRHLFRRSWETLKRVAPLGWGAILLTVMVWTDTVWVRFLRGNIPVGIYAAGNRAGLALSMLGTFYVQGAFPFLSRVSEHARSTFQQCFERVCGDLALMFMPGAIWSIAYAREIIALVFPKAEYLAAVPVFRIFQIAMLLFIVNNLLGTGVLVAFHRDQIFQRILAGTTALFLILSPALTWRWGLRGAAVAVLTSQAVSFLWFSFETRKFARLSPARVLLLPCLAGLAAAALGRFLQLPLQLATPVLGLCYVALLCWRVYGSPAKELESIG